MRDASRLLVTGSRDWTDEVVICSWLDKFRDQIRILCTGGCRGADVLAEKWALDQMIPAVRFPAPWGRGKHAGPTRNEWMAEYFEPTLVLAFHPAIKHSRGTRHMVMISIRRGIDFVAVDADGKSLGGEEAVKEVRYG